ncbi:MAG: DinB family protein [Chloroflexi bacterium]|nr:MAG: DinB family protein [Chloroflexota bacterium]
MLDFARVKKREVKIHELVADLSVDDLRDLTNEMIDDMLGRIEGCKDADVVFEPLDPKARDPYASDESEKEIAWSLGHLIVHVTASSEESAALGAEMARGVEFHGRSRSEIPWRDVTTMAQCRQRLEESRRMRLASLDMWPDTPYLDVVYQPWPGSGPINANGRFVLGLYHDWDHLDQINDVVAQAKAAR